VARAESLRDHDERPWREPNFTLVLENPYVVEGQYLDEKTGEPIPGVRIEVRPFNYRRGNSMMEFVEATSGQDGRYTLRVGSADNYQVKVFPPLGYPGISQFLSSREIERLAGSGRKINYPLKLRAGTVIRGRVVANDTGDPVADAEVVYHPLRNRKLGINSEFLPIKTAADGSFELTGVDGKGFLVVDAPKQGFYRLAADDSRLRYGRAIYPHGVLEIDVPSEGQAEPYSISLHRGPELVARVLDPAGKPVTKFLAGYVEQSMDGGFSQSQDYPDEFFRIDAAQPGRKYRVFIFNEEANAGIVAQLEAPADGKPVDVRLEPCATIRGRYVYDGGMPAQEITNFSHFRVDPGKERDLTNGIHNLPFYDNFVRLQHYQRESDSDGNFELVGIVPGVFMYLSVNYQFADGQGYRTVGTLASGEVKEMGDLVVRPQ
jgi:hypothetical protein